MMGSNTIVRDFDAIRSVTAQQTFLSALVAQAIKPVNQFTEEHPGFASMTYCMSAAMRI